MLLCATAKEGKEGGGVEFVLPPAGSQPGERIYFEGEKYESESKSRNTRTRVRYHGIGVSELTWVRRSTRDAVESQEESLRDYPTCKLHVPSGEP